MVLILSIAVDAVGICVSFFLSPPLCMAVPVSLPLSFLYASIVGVKLASIGMADGLWL